MLPGGEPGRMLPGRGPGPPDGPGAERAQPSARHRGGWPGAQALEPLQRGAGELPTRRRGGPGPRRSRTPRRPTPQRPRGVAVEVPAERLRQIVGEGVSRGGCITPRRRSHRLSWASSTTSSSPIRARAAAISPRARASSPWSQGPSADAAWTRASHSASSREVAAHWRRRGGRPVDLPRGEPEQASGNLGGQEVHRGRLRAEHDARRALSLVPSPEVHERQRRARAGTSSRS